MSVKSIVRGLRLVTSKPERLQELTPEELAERRRRSANQQMFGIQIFDPPKPRPYKAPWQQDRDAKR